MSERREPTISSMPVDGRDDQTRQRAQAAGARPAGGRPPSDSRQSARVGPPPVSSRPVVVKSKLAPLAFLLVLLVGGFAGFSFWLLQNTQKQLAAAVLELESSNGRIAELEKRFMLSDDESTQSITVIQANVKENTSEIRKLWGVAYDRNRKAIAALEDSVEKLEKTSAGFDKKVKAATEELAGELRVLTELLDAQQAAISKADKINTLNQQNIAQIQEKIQSFDGDLRRRVLSNEEAIKAIDAFRLQVNRELLQLKGG